MATSSPPSSPASQDAVTRRAICHRPRLVLDTPGSPSQTPVQHVAHSNKRRTGFLDLPPEMICAVVDALIEINGGLTDGYDRLPEECLMIWKQQNGRWDGEYVFHRFDVWRDLAHLAATCKRLYDMITPSLYYWDASLNHASALHLSAQSGNVDSLLKSLQHGAKPDEEDWTDLDEWEEHHPVHDNEMMTRTYLSTSKTALHWAAESHSAECVEVLLKFGADITLRTGLNERFHAERFHCISYRAVMSFVEPHIDKLVPSSLQRTWRRELQHGANALHFASIPRFVNKQTVPAPLSVVELLLRNGASLMTQDGIRLHVLHQACAWRDARLTRLLLEEWSVDASVTDFLGNTPMHYLAMCLDCYSNNNHNHIVRLLLDHGADINAVNAAGYTPFGMCIMTMQRRPRSSYNAPSTMMALVEGGAHVIPGFAVKLCQMRKRLWDITTGKIFDEVIDAASNWESAFGEPEKDTSDDESEEADTLAVSLAFSRLWGCDEGLGDLHPEGEGMAKKWTLDDWKSFWKT
ncbi:putative ankyrin repeat protein [Colletotrichum spinosum]|uniref:Putative ankyrin repeat protein n=1 Tax=Colletotrichum spinosum TaxID=1347390 RepID=A0A4R8Q225_9PEZI|nr:putative ankyrin repeat protein [Colletotrichum spinosum]